jgi:DNA-binding transcriptional regulator GbsR (MarR family)
MGLLAEMAMMVKLPLHATISAGTRAQKAFQAECLELFSGLGLVLGLPRSIGQIYGLLFASVHPLSFTDIVEQLDISKGSTSQGLRALREVGAIRPVPSTDGRREFFVPEMELRKLVAGLLQGLIKPQLWSGTKRLDEFKARRAAALAEEGEEGRILLTRLSKLLSWHRKGAAVLPLISKFLG